MICRGVLGTRRPKMKVLLPAETQEFQGPRTLAGLSTFFICSFTPPKVLAEEMIQRAKLEELEQCETESYCIGTMGFVTTIRGRNCNTFFI